jgi:hypothetical protein
METYFSRKGKFEVLVIIVFLIMILLRGEDFISKKHNFSI